MSNNIRLPNDIWKFQQTSYSSFNNELLSGINSGLSLYSPNIDSKLYKNTDLKPIENISFDKINENLDKYDINYNKQDDIYNNTKAYIEGAVSAIN